MTTAVVRRKASEGVGASAEILPAPSSSRPAEAPTEPGSPSGAAWSGTLRQQVEGEFRPFGKIHASCPVDERPALRRELVLRFSAVAHEVEELTQALASIDEMALAKNLAGVKRWLDEMGSSLRERRR